MDHSLGHRARAVAVLRLRTSLSPVTFFGASALASGAQFFGAVAPGNLGPHLLAFLVGGSLTLVLERWQRRRYGQATKTWGSSEIAIGFLPTIGFVLMVMLGTKWVPHPLLVAQGFFFAGIAALHPWRVSWHWLVPAAASFWMSVLMVTGPAGLFRHGIEGLVLGTTVCVAASIDFFLLEKAIANTRRAIGEQVAHG